MIKLLARSFSADTINILLAHLFASGAETSGSEWVIHTGLPYAVSPARFPDSAQYIGLGHLHRPQKLMAAPVPCQYAGSPLQLDFGEQQQRKRVVLIEARPGLPVHTESIPLTAGRNLRDVEGRIDEIEAKAEELRNDYLRVTVIVDGPVPGLADRIRERLPNAVYVRTKSATEAPISPPCVQLQLKPEERFQQFFHRQYGQEPSTELIEVFRFLYQEALHATD